MAKEFNIITVIFSLTVFTGAFLLFQVQPIINKVMLPWFGGSSNVWITSMLFFQIALIVGYLYAYLLSKLKKTSQVLVHTALIIFVGVYVLTLLKSQNTFGYMFNADALITANPTIQIMKILALTIGLPYLTLASTGPLLQKWFKESTNKEPYWLYVVSNVASIAAIALYPFVIEPFLTLNAQSKVWEGSFLIYALLLVTSCFISINEIVAETTKTAEKAVKLNKLQIGEWLILAAMPVITLLAVTNELTQEIATIPFLWLFPLLTYLLSFVFAFSDKHPISKRSYIKFFFGTAVTASLYTLSFSLSIIVDLLVLISTLFAVSMVCHMSLYEKRPPHIKQLTIYYLLISIGGAIGGLIVSVVFPFVFNDFYDLNIAVIATLGVVLYLSKNEKNGVTEWFKTRDNFQFLRMMLLLLLIAPVTYKVYKNYNGQVEMVRNFYGVVKVSKPELYEEKYYIQYMTHGTTLHGLQYEESPYKENSYLYYTKESGGGVALSKHPNRLENKPIRAGIVGLGVGSLISYCKTNDTFEIYEINPAVVDLAKKHFTYLEQCKNLEVTIGDARISMEQELKENAPKFDVLILDAFSDDSIPIHLLTLEAFETYLKLLKDEKSILVFHISNRQVDLVPVLNNVAEHFGLNMEVTNSGINYGPELNKKSELKAVWVTLTKNEELLKIEEIVENKAINPKTRKLVWTDDFSNLFNVLYFTESLH